MAPDKYKAVWVSHSSIADFLKCPRAYYLRNVYKDPKTGHKITHMQPPLALGQAVHDVLEEISTLPVNARFSVPLTKRLNVHWENVSGKKGGFLNKEVEDEYRQRGMEMLKKVEGNPGPLANKAIKIGQDLPYYWLSEEDNIILCGKIDWLEYLPDNDSVHIIDFKTGKAQEDGDSLQLPIYYLLAVNTQGRKIDKVSYWYLSSGDSLVQKELPNLDDSFAKVYKVAKRMKLARQIEIFNCPKDGCYSCRPLERILKGEGELVGISSYNQDIYILED